MSGHKTILIFFLALCVQASAQKPGFTSSPRRPGAHALVLYVSGGANYYVGDEGTPDFLSTPTTNKLNPMGSLRLMWHPDHLLKLGLETGYLTFYGYHFTDSTGSKGKVNVNAVPLLVEWSTSVTRHLNFFGGSGVYFLTTNLDYMGKTRSGKISVGWMVAASYIVPLSKNAGLGTELKWMNAAETSNGSLSLQLQLVWRLIDF